MEICQHIDPDQKENAETLQKRMVRGAELFFLGRDEMLVEKMRELLGANVGSVFSMQRIFSQRIRCDDVFTFYSEGKNEPTVIVYLMSKGKGEITLYVSVLCDVPVAWNEGFDANGVAKALDNFCFRRLIRPEGRLA